MQFKVFTLITTLMIITSCVSKNSQAVSCKKNSLLSQGQKDGSIGVDYLESIQKLCSKFSKESVAALYDRGRMEGLKIFCSSKRAENRALLNLELEEDCKDFPNYVAWFEKSLKDHCTKELALKDSKNLRPSNTNCMKSDVYSYTFMNGLKKSCTNAWAKKQGFQEQKLSPYCLKTKQKQSLILSHKQGFEKKLNQSNSLLKAKASMIKTKIKALKNTKLFSNSEKIENKQMQEKLSTQLLETLHAIEQNNLKL